MRKLIRVLRFWLAVLTMVWALPGVVQAQFTFTTNNGTITITGYTGPGGAVDIPSEINGLPVTSIGEYAFDDCSNMTSVAIGGSVTNIGALAFCACTGLTNVMVPSGVIGIGGLALADCPALSAITVAGSNLVYSSVDGVLFDKSQTLLIQCPGGKSGTYSIPNSVANIADGAFLDCAHLTSVTIPNAVLNIGSETFEGCSGLAAYHDSAQPDQHWGLRV